MATIFMARMLMVRLSMRSVCVRPTIQRKSSSGTLSRCRCFLLALTLSFSLSLSSSQCLSTSFSRSFFYTSFLFPFFASFWYVFALQVVRVTFRFVARRIWGFPTHIQLINKSWLWNKWQVAISTGYMTETLSSLWVVRFHCFTSQIAQNWNRSIDCGQNHFPFSLFISCSLSLPLLLSLTHSRYKNF